MTIAIIFVALLLIGVPVAFTLGLIALAYIALETPLPPLVAFQRMFTSVDSFPFVAIPFFMLAGNLMGAGGLAHRIIDLARALVGHLRGGLANVTVVSNMIMGGISGSSVADCSALGSILIPAMKNQGYQPRFAGAVNATASTMGIIIPPSIPMILTGAATSLSIRDLFFGGLVPGILIGLGMLVITTTISKKRDYPKFPRATARELLKATWRGLPAFIMVAIILVGIMTGIFTPTEASVAAVLYAILVGVIDRELTWKGFYDSMLNAAVSSAVVMIVISTAGLLTWLLAYSMIPQQLTVYARRGRRLADDTAGRPRGGLPAGRLRAGRLSGGPALRAGPAAPGDHRRGGPHLLRGHDGFRSRHRPDHAARRHDDDAVGLHRRGDHPGYRQGERPLSHLHDRAALCSDFLPGTRFVGSQLSLSLTAGRV